jgi:hypothetical protein
MPGDESALLVPLRSNGSALLAGSPVEPVRRRLKTASISFDQIFLEAGTYRLQAGPGGSFAVVDPPRPDKEPRWQTSAQRHAEQTSSFGLAVGRETTPGVPAAVMHGVISSEATASWVATLEPFARELPADTDWIGFTRTPEPANNMRRVKDRWDQIDKRNSALERAIPEQFVRAAMIGDANRDLAVAMDQNMAISMDLLHAQVIAQRFNDDGLAMHGFAAPILFREVSEWPWEASGTCAATRTWSASARSCDVEQEAAVGGDTEAAAHHAFERHLADALEAVESIGAVVHKTLRGFVIGGMVGFATVGIAGPLGVVASAAAGAVPGAVLDVRNVIRQHRNCRWVTVYQRIDGMR